ncbi:MAG: prepilin peptidase [Armatimonadetes bacterium]|nr:prepilin peptidase [Armatimonadota bacterium]
MSVPPSCAIAFAYGLFIGSFLNVCILRLPRGESIVKPPSHCTSCGEPLKPWHNIPLLSYLFLRGRCRTCGIPFSSRYFWVELLTGLGVGFLFCRLGLSLEFFVSALFFALLVVIFFIDLDHQLILDSTSFLGIALGLLSSLFRGIFWDALIGVLVSAALFYVIAIVSVRAFQKEGMGGGDVKLAALIGAFLGWKLALLSFFVSFFLGAVVGIALMAARIIRRKEYIPFGPFMAVGAMVAYLWGAEILNWYFSRTWGMTYY